MNRPTTNGPLAVVHLGHQSMMLPAADALKLVALAQKAIAVDRFSFCSVKHHEVFSVKASLRISMDVITADQVQGLEIVKPTKVKKAAGPLLLGQS